MKNEIISTYMWDHSTGEEIRMDMIGLVLFNRERRKLGLKEYKYNLETGTFDEN